MSKYVEWQHEWISVLVVFIDYVEKVLNPVATLNVLIWTAEVVSDVAAAPVVAARRVSIIPRVVHTVDDRVFCVVDEVVMVYRAI
jgi:hypothetical protein